MEEKGYSEANEYYRRRFGKATVQATKNREREIKALREANMARRLEAPEMEKEIEEMEEMYYDEARELEHLE